jgi:hypothetical protein
VKRELLRVLCGLASSRCDSALSFVLVSAMAGERRRRVSGYRSWVQKLGTEAGSVVIAGDQGALQVHSVTSHLVELRGCGRRSCGVRVVIAHRSPTGTC